MCFVSCLWNVSTPKIIKNNLPYIILRISTILSVSLQEFGRQELMFTYGIQKKDFILFPYVQSLALTLFTKEYILFKLICKATSVKYYISPMCNKLFNLCSESLETLNGAGFVTRLLIQFWMYKKHSCNLGERIMGREFVLYFWD